MDYKSGVILRGYDIVDLIKNVSKINKKHQATLLSNLENTITDADLFLQVRKHVLDSFNNYTRQVVSEIFGDIDV